MVAMAEFDLTDRERKSEFRQLHLNSADDGEVSSPLETPDSGAV